MLKLLKIPGLFQYFSNSSFFCLNFQIPGFQATLSGVCCLQPWTGGGDTQLQHSMTTKLSFKVVDGVWVLNKLLICMEIKVK